MKETMIDLFQGNIMPREHLGVGNREIAQLDELVERTHQKLLCGLTDGQKKFLQNIGIV